MLKLTKTAVLAPWTHHHRFSKNYHQIKECGCYNLEISIPAIKIRQNFGYLFSGRGAHEISDFPQFHVSVLQGKILQRLQN